MNAPDTIRDELAAECCRDNATRLIALALSLSSFTAMEGHDALPPASKAQSAPAINRLPLRPDVVWAGGAGAGPQGGDADHAQVGVRHSLTGAELHRLPSRRILAPEDDAVIRWVMRVLVVALYALLLATILLATRDLTTQVALIVMATAAAALCAVLSEKSPGE